MREIARIGRIVRDYLDSTRSLEPERKPTSLRQILDEAVELAGGVERADGADRHRGGAPTIRPSSSPTRGCCARSSSTC